MVSLSLNHSNWSILRRKYTRKRVINSFIFRSFLLYLNINWQCLSTRKITHIFRSILRLSSLSPSLTSINLCLFSLRGHSSSFFFHLKTKRWKYVRSTTSHHLLTTLSLFLTHFSLFSFSEVLMKMMTRKVCVFVVHLWSSEKWMEKAEVRSMYDEKSPAPRLNLTAFCMMNRNEDERMSNLSLVLLLFYINYEKNVERLYRLIICFLSKWMVWTDDHHFQRCSSSVDAFDQS